MVYPTMRFGLARLDSPAGLAFAPHNYIYGTMGCMEHCQTKKYNSLYVSTFLLRSAEQCTINDFSDRDYSA